MKVLQTYNTQKDVEFLSLTKSNGDLTVKVMHIKNKKLKHRFKGYKS